MRKLSKVIVTFIVVISLVMLSAGTVMAKPLPEVSVGSIVCGPSSNLQVSVQDINWLNIRPLKVSVLLYESDTTNLANSSGITAPKGKAAKYPQNTTVTVKAEFIPLSIGEEYDVKVILKDRKDNIIYDSGVLTTITWGTASTWTS